MALSRRAFLAATQLFLASQATHGAASAAADRPNVIFISIDDLNDWVSVLGHLGVVTPGLDRLAASGMTFTKAYCTAPACNPSRVSVLAGLSPATTSVYGNGEKFRRYLPDAVTLPQYLRENGYRTFGGGKVFHGGFDYASVDYAAPPEAVAWRDDSQDPASWDVFHYFLEEPFPAVLPANGLQWPDSVEVIDWDAMAISEDRLPDAQLARWAADFLDDPTPAPFFLAVGFYRPHLPWYTPKRYFDLYPLEEVSLPEVRADDLDDIPDIAKEWATRGGHHDALTKAGLTREAVQAYLASISFADHQLEIVLDAWERSPARERTVIVLWSDHGFHLGEKMHWRKFALWEEATRVPLIIVAPGIAEPGSRCDRVVSLLDLYPTLLDLCGLPANEDLEGQSLVPLLKDPTRDWPRPALMTFGALNHAVRSERWRYISYKTGDEELYDHDNDPHEWVNLASDPEYQDIKDELGQWIPSAFEERLQSYWWRFLNKIERNF
jgi:arylsulfatase A-like enzyme